MKYLLPLLLFSCKSIMIEPSRPILAQLSPWTFQTEANGYMCTASVIEHRLVTAGHCEKDNKIQSKDLAFFGTCYETGLEVCEIEPLAPEPVYLNHTRGLIIGRVMEVKDSDIYIEFDRPVIPGDSGTPVFCMHGKVIGILTRYEVRDGEPDLGGSCHGILTSITKKDVQ